MGVQDASCMLMRVGKVMTRSELLVYCVAAIRNLTVRVVGAELTVLLGIMLME